jgi:hypothetical protein
VFRAKNMPELWRQSTSLFVCALLSTTPASQVHGHEQWCKQPQHHCSMLRVAWQPASVLGACNLAQVPPLRHGTLQTLGSELSGVLCRKRQTTGCADHSCTQRFTAY